MTVGVERPFFGKRVVCALCGAHTHKYLLKRAPAAGDCLLGMGDIEGCAMQEWMAERELLRREWRARYPEHHEADGTMIPGRLALIIVAENMTRPPCYYPIFRFIPYDLVVEARVREALAEAQADV